MAKELNLNRETVRKILTVDLGLRKFSAKMVSRILSDEKKQSDFLVKKSITKLDHPPCWPDLAPCDFWLFPELKIALKRLRLDDISDIQHHVAKELKTIPDDQVQELLAQWKHRLSVLTHKGITLKVTVAASSQVIKDNFYVVIPGTKLFQWYTRTDTFNTLLVCIFFCSATNQRRPVHTMTHHTR